MYGCITTQGTAGEILTVNIDVEFNSFDRNPSSKNILNCLPSIRLMVYVNNSLT